MFKRILIPTDGSEVARKAIRQWHQLRQGTRVRPSSGTTPPKRSTLLSIPTLESVRPMVRRNSRNALPSRVSYTLTRSRKTCKAAGVACETPDDDARQRPYSGSHRRRAKEELRPHLHGFARTRRVGSADSRQRHLEGIGALEDPGAGLPLIDRTTG